MPGRHRQRLRHAAATLQRGEAQRVDRDRAQRARLAHLLPQVPGQLLQGLGPSEPGQDLPLQRGPAAGRIHPGGEQLPALLPRAKGMSCLS